MAGLSPAEINTPAKAKQVLRGPLFIVPALVIGGGPGVDLGLKAGSQEPLACFDRGSRSTNQGNSDTLLSGEVSKNCMFPATSLSRGWDLIFVTILFAESVPKTIFFFLCWISSVGNGRYHLESFRLSAPWGVNYGNVWVLGAVSDLGCKGPIHQSVRLLVEQWKEERIRRWPRGDTRLTRSRQGAEDHNKRQS